MRIVKPLILQWKHLLRVHSALPVHELSVVGYLKGYTVLFAFPEVVLQLQVFA